MEVDISENDWKPRLFLLFLSDNLQLFLKFLNCRINTKICMHIVCRTKQEIDETGRQYIPTLEQH